MTYSEAKDAIFAIAQAAFAASLLPSLDVRWPGMAHAGLPPNDTHWVRVFYSNARDVQASLAKLNGVSRYEAKGLLIVQIYSPISVAGSLDNGNILAEKVQAAYRSAAPGILTFTNHVIKEAGNTNTHYQTNVMVECTYDNFQ